MKFIFFLLFLIFCLSPLSATLNCITYEPFSNSNYPSNVDLALNSDLQSLSSQGFTCIKTYYSQYYGLKIAQYAKKYNLQIVLGIWMEHNSEINAAIYSCLNYDNVISLYAGSENLPTRTTQSMLDIKARKKKWRMSNAFWNCPNNRILSI